MTRNFFKGSTDFGLMLLVNKISQWLEKNAAESTVCTCPVLPSSVHVCIYSEWFTLWLFLELDFLLWNIVLEISGPVCNLIAGGYAIDFGMNILEVSLLLWKEGLFISQRSLVNT